MNKEAIRERPLGKIQIYLKPRDQVKSQGLLARLQPKQLYRELVKYAKADGLLNASVYQTHSSYSLHEPVQMAHVELANHELALCVELIDEKDKLEAFCTKHAALLRGKLIVFKAVEFWELT